MNSLQCLFGRGRVNQALHRVTVRFSLGTAQPVCTNTHSLSKLRPPTAPRCRGQPRIPATAPLPLTEHQPRTPCHGPTASCSPHIPGRAQSPGTGPGSTVLQNAPQTGLNSHRAPGQKGAVHALEKRVEFWKQSPLPAKTLL